MKICELCGLAHANQEYTLPNGSTHDYCPECAEAMGFCPVCGTLCETPADADSLLTLGLCQHCAWEFNAINAEVHD